MALYSIENVKTGESLGVYQADSVVEALEAMARDAGYATYAEACEVSNGADDLRVVEM